MPTRRRATAAALVACLGVPSWVRGATPAARPLRVQVLATTDRRAAQGLIDDFETRHPQIAVDYVELGSVELDRRVRTQDAASAADVLWSSAMDLQIKLVNDGYAARHASLHAASLPRWAVWKHEAYGSGLEPVGMLVRRELLDASAVPRTHAALAARLRDDAQYFAGRVATYDIARAGLGYLLAGQDLMANPQHWELLRALGRCGVSLHADTQSMLERVAGGGALLAYNVLGSYAEAFARKHPDVAVVYFDDYTLVASRVAFVARDAPHPREARLWLDHLLSVDGQRALARSGGLFPIRSDVPDAPELAARALRPITLGPGLLAYLDQSKRESLLRRWRGALRPDPP